MFLFFPDMVTIMKLCDLYNSFHELYDSILRGNEMEFMYNGKRYYILPCFNDANVNGCCFGEAYADVQVFCGSEQELYRAKVGNALLGEIISEVSILWYNF